MPVKSRADVWTGVGVTPTLDPPYGVGKRETLGVGRVRVVV